MRTFLLIAFIYLTPLAAWGEIYIDQITENGKHYIVIDKENLHAKVEVSPNDTEDQRVEKVCKVVRCNGKK